MATRKSEWLASIKPILDREEAKRDAKELAKELGNLLEIDIDASPENLKKLTDEFNKQLSQMGKQPIVFSEKTLQGIVNQFANAVTEGFSKGANVGLEETFKLQLANLKKQKEALLKEQDDINRRLSNRSRIEKINNFSIESAHGLPIDKDVVKQAEKMLDEMYEYADRISELQAEQGKESEEYISTVLDAQEAYNKFLRMQKSLKKTKPALPNDLKAAYDLFKGDEEERYRVAGGKTTAFDYDKYGGEIILDAFEEVSDVLINTDDQLNDIQKRLKEIDLQIESIVAQAKAAGAVDDTILGGSKDGLKTLKEIEDAYGRIVKKSKKTGGKVIDNVTAAVDYVPGSESLATLRNRYNTSLSSNEDWEIQYQWLVKFVKEYENYSAQIEAETDSDKRRNMRARQRKYTALYEELKPMAENAETMLRGIIDVSGGKQPTGVKDGSTGPTPEDVANAEQIALSERQAREDAEAKAKAEAEAAEAAKQKRIEEEKAAKAAEKKRIADEAAAEAQRQAAEEAEKERLAKEASVTADKTRTYTGYRAIEPPSGSGKTKDDALTDWGGEYFSTDKNVAASYGENFFEKGNIIIGEITPKAPLVINANGLRWDEFDKMPGVKELFPGILELMKDPRYIGDDGQKYINEQAKLAGYDSVILENVQDALDGDIKEYDLSTTIAVLDDKIVSLVGSMAQLEAGTNKFSGTVSPKIPSYYVGGQRGDEGASAEVQDVGTAFKHLIDYIKSSGQEPKQFFDALTEGAQNVDDELKQILSTLGLFDSQGNLSLKSIESGFTNLGGMVSDTYTLIARGKDYLPKSQDLMPKLADAKQMGANVGEILDVFEDEATGRIYELQRTMSGTIIPDNTDFLQATDEQILNLIADLQTLHKTGLYVDFGNDNILYDKEQGFSFIDLGTKLQDGQETVAGTAQELLKSIKPVFADNELFGNFESRLVSIASILGVKIPQAAQNAEQAIDRFNSELQETENTTPRAASTGGVGDASSAELEAATTKVEALQNEVEQKNQEIAAKDDEIVRIQTKSDAEKRALDDAKATLQNDLDETRQQLVDSEYEKGLYDSAMNQLTEESNEKDRIIYDLREQLANVKTGVGEEQASVSSEELKNVLSSIVYNVKIAHDDNDKQANKIAVDESELESTLKRVFSNILNPHTEQNDSEPKNEPWALEKTLLSVKEALAQIQTNTAKSKSIEVAPAKTDTGNVLATESTLAAIKTAVETINKKVVKGTKPSTGGTVSGTNKRTGQSGAYDISERVKTQRVQLAKLATQLATSGRLTDNVGIQISKLLSELDEVEKGPDLSKWIQRFTQLKATINIDDMFNKVVDDSEKDAYEKLLNYQKTRNQLELQYTKAADGSQLKAFYKEQLDVMDDLISTQLILNENEEYAKKLAEERTKQEIKLGAERAKQADREAKTAKKEMQKQAMLGKAGNAVGRAQGVYIEAEGLNPKKLPKSFTQKGGVLDNYYSAFEKLRQKQIELSKLDVISDEQKKDLRDQINNVNQMTSEIGELVSQYQRLSGDNVKELGINTLRPNAGLKEYEAELKRLASASANGKIQIKSFDNETKTLTYTVKNAKREVTTYTATLRGLDNQFVAVARSTKRSETFFEATKRKMAEISSYMSGMAVLSRAAQELRRGIQYIREIDLALTELKKVTDETEETYDKFLKTAAKTGARLGTTISAVTDATATFAKLGYSMEQATEMAEAAIVYKNVGDNIESTGDAADSIISTMKGFRLEASESMAIVDRFNEVGNRFAITSQGIGEALRLSASALSEGGNSLDESIGLITAANEVVNDPSSVGTALKTLTLRLRGSKTELEEMGEDVSDMATTTSQLQAKLLALTGGKVDIMLDENTFKNSTQILREMADAWEDMNDIQRASALELMGGKRQANVLSALIQNFATVEAVIETSADSAGSALKENERYLDSIQGKIDQFNNAIQAMWSNALDSDFVKWIVDVGTGLIKILDKLKPIYLLISGIAVYLNKKYNFVDFSRLFEGFRDAFSNSKGPKDFFKNLINGFKNTEISIEKAQEKLKELEEQKAKLGDPKSEKNRRKVDVLDQEINKYKEMLKPSEDLIIAQNKLNAAQKRLDNYKSKGGNNANTIKKYERDVNKAKIEVDNLTAAQKKSAQSGKTAFAGLGKSVKKFGKQVVSVVTQMLVMWAITKVIELIVQGVDNLITTAEEAAEKYEELNSELDTLKSNIEDINDELSTLDDQIAELTAKGSLSFTEKEELERLRAEREELERTLELNQQLAKQKQQQVNNQTSDQVAYYRNKGKKTGKTTGELAATGAIAGTAVGVGATAAFGAKLGTAIGTAIAPGVGSAVGAVLGVAVGAIVGAAAGAGIGAGIGASEEKVGDSIDNMEEKLAKKEEEVRKAREKYQKSGKDKDREKYEKAQQALSDYRGEMAQYFTDLDAMYQNVDLSTIEDPDEYKRLKEEMNDFYNERDKWLIESGAEGAKSNTIGRIFDKDDYENASKTIDALVKKLEKDPTDQNAISQISQLCKVAEKDLEAVGLTVQDAIDYFTMLGQNAAFGTIEGKVSEMTAATSRLQTLLSNTNSADFAGLFGQDGEVSATAIAEYFQGTSEATRTEIARLVKEINEGEISVENALKQFELFSIQSSLDIYITEVQTNFKDVFADLEDADGLIDTFQELGQAIGSTADALKVFNKAEEEMADGGRVSIQTALELMEYTDDYGSILQVVDGKLQLVDNAEEVLIQTRIDAIKTSAQASLEDATNAYEKAKLATATYKTALDTDMSASVVASAWEKVLAAGAGLWEGIKSLVTDESWTEAYNRGYNATLSNITGYETVYDDSGLQALADAEAEAKSAMEDAQDRVELANQLTPETLKSINEYEDPDEDDDGIDDEKESEAQKGWEKLVNKYENKLALLSNERDLIEAEIDKAEARGGKASAKYYEDLINNSAAEKKLLEQKKAALEKYLRANAGAIDQDTWTEYNNEINATAVAIKECEINTIEWAEAIREIDLHYFEQASDEISRLGEELDFVNSLLEDEEVADENGNWSSAALTRMGLYTQQMEKAAVEAARYQDEINDLNEKYANGALSEEEYQESLSNLVSGQQDAIQSYEDAKDGIVELNEARIDAIKEGIEKEIEAYEDLIDAKKEELDAERELHDFREDVKDQTKDIASLERRIAALSGSSSASDIAERRKLEAQLLKAKEGLNDTYYNHSRDAQSAALDEEAEAYTLSKERYIEQLEEQLKDTETLIQNSIMDVMLNADTVYTELNELADLYGVDLSDSLTQPWKDASAQAIKWKDELKASMTSGEYAALIGEGGAVTGFANGVATKLQGSWTKAQTAAKNYAGYLTGAELKNNFTNTLTGFGNQIQNIIDKWNGVKKAADDAYAAQTRKVTVGGTGIFTTGASGGGGGGGNTGTTTATKTTTSNVKLRGLMQTSREIILGSKSFVDKNTEAINGIKYYKDSNTGYYYKISDLNSNRKYDGGRTTGWAIPKGTWFYTKNAKGTTGTKRDEWGLTDEPQFGDELVLIPTPQGNLSYMRKGTGVVPADLTANLMEWGQFTPDSMNLGGGVNVNMINNAVNKPEFNFAFDALVKAENITEETLPAVKKLVTQELNRFTKELNYALKGKGAR